MTPATWAAASASPFGRSRSRRAVSGAMRTVARATARRRETGLPPTSTMRTSPASLTWLNSLIPPSILTAGRRGHAVERGEQRVRPPVQVVLAHMSANRLEPRLPLTRFHRQGTLDRLGLTLDVERIHGQRPLTELCVSACVFR